MPKLNNKKTIIKKYYLPLRKNCYSILKQLNQITGKQFIFSHLIIKEEDKLSATIKNFLSKGKENPEIKNFNDIAGWLDGIRITQCDYISEEMKNIQIGIEMITNKDTFLNKEKIADGLYTKLDLIFDQLNVIRSGIKIDYY